MSLSYNILNPTDHGLRNPRSGRGGPTASQVVSQRNPWENNNNNYCKFNIGTWNVRTMLKPSKIEEISQQMINGKLDILGISETRWQGNGEYYIKNDLRIIHSGGEKRGSKGVAIILRGKWKNNVLNTFHVNERIIMIKLQAQPTDMYIIQVYFSTTICEEEEIEIMYQQLEELLKITDNKSNVFVMGDFNASVGSQMTGHECVGKFGLGNTNERGEKMIEFCKQFEMIIINH